MAGTINNPKRPRYQANERFDTSDADVASRASREHMSALMRALLSKPESAGGAAMTGLIVTGFDFSLNPTGPSDNKIRVSAGVGIALDADGNLLVKDAGTADITIGAGSQQVYIYFSENSTDVAKRRFLSVSPPYAESSQSIPTTFQGTVAYFVRAGTNANVVAEDTVNGVTTALCCIGIVTNTAGAITCTGYNAVTAPNGTDNTKPLTAANPPTSPPTTNTMNGSMQSLTEMIRVLAHQVGQSAWKGSAGLTPAAGNDYGAYQTPAGGVDAAFRGELGYVTVGNGTTIVGDFNTSDYANNKLMLEAAFGALPSLGGTVLIKQGVTLSGFGGGVVANAGLKKIIIQGYHVQGLNISPIITFATGEWFEMTNLQLKDLWIQHADHAMKISGGGYTVTNCVFDRPDSAVNKAAIINNTLGSGVTGLICEDVVFRTSMAVNNGTVNAMAIDLTGGTAASITLRRVVHSIPGDECGSLTVTDLRDDFVIDDYECQGGGSATNLVFPYLISLATTTNANITNRIIRNFRANGTVSGVTAAFYSVLSTGNVGHLLVDRMRTHNCMQSTKTITAPSDCMVTYRDCHFSSGRADAEFAWIQAAAAANMAGVIFEGCTFEKTGVTTGAEVLNIFGRADFLLDYVRVSDCRFIGHKRTAFPITLINISCQGTLGKINTVIVERCEFTDVQNVAYTGSTGVSALVYVATVKSNHVAVRDCRVTEVMTGTSGNDREQAFLLRTFGPGTAGWFDNIQIDGNYVGSDDSNDVCGLWHHTEQHIRSASVSNNSVRIAWETAAGKAKWLQGSVVLCTGTTNALFAHRQISFNNNQIAINNIAATDFTKDTYYFNCLASSEIRNHSIQGNNFFCTSNKFDYLTAYGINVSTVNHGNIAVAGNNCAAPSVADSWRIRAQGVVSLGQFNDVTPGTGLAVPGNNGLYGQG